MGKNKLMSLEQKQGVFDLFSHSERCKDSYMAPARMFPACCVRAVCILLHTLYLLLGQ